MTTSVNASPTFRRAVLLMTASSFLVPAGGLLTAPILARALSTDGRGELAAAIAPAALMLAAATLGLPDALTYYLAKHPRATRSALFAATLVTVGLGFVCLGATVAALSFLSAGNKALGHLILLAMVWTIPALVVNVLRGAAMGRQMWTAVAVERLIITTVRVLGFGLLFVGDNLTVRAGVLVNVVTPIVAGIVYWPLLRSPQGEAGEISQGTPDQRMLATIISFGSRVWVGSVASMVLARASQLLMTPLSSATDLGLYSVASTVSDLPLIIALAIQGALFGVNSKARDPEQVASTARLTLLLALVGCTALGGSLALWIKPLFGADFGAATIPTVMLLCSAVLCIPGLMAATGLSAWGRPGLRSIGLTVTLVANVTAFVLLVPRLGVLGACWTSIVSNFVMTTFMVLAASRAMGLSAREFFLIRGTDLTRTWHEAMTILRQLRGHLRS